MGQTETSPSFSEVCIFTKNKAKALNMKSIALSIFFLLSHASNIHAFSVGKNRVFVGTPINERRRIIQDCMTPISQLCTLTSDATVDEAVFLMLDHGISGAPVIDKKSGELLGIVSTYDFLQQEAGEGQLLPIQGTLEDVKAYLSQAKKVSIGLYYNIVDFFVRKT